MVFKRDERFLKTVVTASVLVFASFSHLATADIDNPAMNTGYVNVFDSATSADCGGGFCFGSGWAVGDLKASVNGASVTLQPNFNTYNATDAYWANGAVGNKTVEANLFEEIGAVPAGTGSYSWGGFVDSNTLDAAYTATAFIKVLDSAAGYADVLGASQALPSSGEFSVSGDLTAYEGDARYILQVGFQVVGLNANPDDEDALGNISARIGASTAIGAGDSSALVDPTGIPVMPLWGLLGLAGLIGLMGYRRKQA